MSQCVKQIVSFIHSEINCCCKIQLETLSYACIYSGKMCLLCEADQWLLFTGTPVNAISKMIATVH